ncbi:DUF805 domain-containing protein [Brevundimonas sp.]|uniref:DUF805 domain-containing protein n=1 Tax=Brevundimonas sp. TaxID=1871086 RepID=UPI0028970947|nr:DUF805 domain-containing protein [Brevundimonas sp.]
MKVTNWFLNFDFNGRARRAHTWANWFAWAGIWIVLWIIMISVAGAGVAAENAGNEAAAAGAGGLGVVGIFVMFAAWLLAFIDSMAMNFRRAHDTGKSGWIWLLLLIPLVNLLPLYWLLIEDSQQGPNKYGPPVKQFYEPNHATN